MGGRTFVVVDDRALAHRDHDFYIMPAVAEALREAGETVKYYSDWPDDSPRTCLDQYPWPVLVHWARDQLHGHAYIRHAMDARVPCVEINHSWFDFTRWNQFRVSVNQPYPPMPEDYTGVDPMRWRAMGLTVAPVWRQRPVPVVPFGPATAT